jgi:hypothetical protein
MENKDAMPEKRGPLIAPTGSRLKGDHLIKVPVFVEFCTAPGENFPISDWNMVGQKGHSGKPADRTETVECLPESTAGIPPCPPL